ncbi:hypothetical protein PACTADRAFT_19973, partial [Pachysolen tannophilus NRRL Y-2460]
RQLNQYFPVVLQIGSRFIKAGFAGDATPLCNLQTNNLKWNQHLNREICITDEINELTQTGSAILTNDHSIDPHGDEFSKLKNNNEKLLISTIYCKDLINSQWLWNYDISSNFDSKFLENLLERIFHDIYQTELLIDAKMCKIILIENIFLPIPLKNILSYTLLNHIHARSLIYVSEPTMCCIGAGIQNALVIDLGWEATTIVPVYDLRIIHNNIESTNRSGKYLHYEILEKLIQVVGFEKLPSFNDKYKLFEFIENFISKCCYINDKENIEGDFIISDNCKIPNKLRCDLVKKLLFPPQDLWPNLDSNEKSIIDLIINKILINLPIDLRTKLFGNIIITGGLSHIPGIKSYIAKQLQQLTTIPIELVHSLGPWSGASLYGSTFLM